MYYPQEVVDEVLANTDIADVISAHVHLKKRGRDYVGLCPFHNEKTPSFTVSPGKNMFYCFGCGAGGNAVTFLMKYNNSTFTRSLTDAAYARTDLWLLTTVSLADNRYTRDRISSVQETPGRERLTNRFA